MDILGNLSLLLLGGLFLGKIAEQCGLPSLVGMLVAGILIGPSNLGLLFPALRSFALIVILLRAGLSLEPRELMKIRGTVIRLSIIPCLLEGVTVLVFARWLLGFSWAEAGVLGFVLASVSPAVVVPSMLNLHAEGYGTDKQIPTLILAGAALDDVFAIALFGVFLTFATGAGNNPFASLVGLPWSILGGIIGGLILGFLLVNVFSSLKNVGDTEKLVLTLLLSALFLELSTALNFTGLLGVMTMGLVLTEKSKPLARRFNNQLTKIWVVAQIMLFTLVGASVNLQVALRGSLMGILLIFLGLAGRSLGVWFGTRPAGLSAKERWFCIIAYLPKATIQAAIGGLPLAAGLESGGLILAISALAILITAPLGAIGIRKSAPLLLTKGEQVRSNLC